jgi:type IV pilus assembly protein PilZ
MNKAILAAAKQDELHERRKSERVGLVVRVTYHSVDEIFSEFARNINEGGIFIETDSPQQPGSEVVLQFQLPGNDELIEVSGIVVRTTRGDESDDSSGMGIEFGNLNTGARQRINELIRQLRANA